MELSAVLRELFEGGRRPCHGIPWDEYEQPSRYDVIQRPISGKSSKACHVLLGKDADPDSVSCPECLKLSRSASEWITDEKSNVETEEFGEHELVDEDKDIFTPFGSDIDDVDKNITKSENDENEDYISAHEDFTPGSNIGDLDKKITKSDKDNYVSAHDEINKDSDRSEGRKYRETNPQSQCTMCDKSFTKKSLHIHYTRIHLKGKFQCPDCEFRADFAHDLIKHMQENEHESQIACPYCLKKGKDCKFSKFDIASHYRSCVQKTLRCPHCDGTFRTTEDMLDHKKIVHLWGEFRCQQCDFR